MELSSTNQARPPDHGTWRSATASTATTPHRTTRAADAPDPALLVNYVPAPQPPPPPQPAIKPVPTAHDPVTLHNTVREQISLLFPDIRHAAARHITQRLAQTHQIQLDADRSYFNTFKSYHVEDTKGQLPLASLSLTDLQLNRDAIDIHSLPASDEMSGIFTEGRWSTHFDSTNKIDLLPSDVLACATEGDFLGQYRDTLRTWWNDHFDTLQLLAELNVEAYVQEHRSEGNRAQALGLSPQLGLSEHALGMLAEAIGRPFPDQPPLGTRSLRLDINGYDSTDITWLCDRQGRVLLHIPGDARALREYPNLAAMRADVREMTRHLDGRAALAQHFSAYNRGNGAFRYGVDRWLRDLSDSHGNYDYAIAYYGTNASAASMTLPSARHAPPLLSNKAVAMLSEAAGYPDPGLGTFSTQSYLLDINGIPAIDVLWLQAGDGHVVLLLPDDPRPVREYANVTAMRQDLARLILDPAGAAGLARHFAVEDRRCTATYDGVDEWLRKISTAPQQYLERIAFDRQRHHITQVSIFHKQTARRRADDITRASALASANWTSADERWRWVRGFETGSQFFTDHHSLKRACASEIGPMPEREQRSDDDAVARCLNVDTRPMRWGQSLGQRLGLAAQRLQDAQAVADSSIDDQITALSTSTLRQPPHKLDLPQDRQRNALGFLERTDLGQLYAVVEKKAGIDTHELPRARSMEGEHVYTFFLSEDAARRMAILRWGAAAGNRYPLYRLDAHGLEAVSFGDNRANNPNFGALMASRESDFLTDEALASQAARAAARDMLENAVQVKFASIDNAQHRMTLSRHRGAAAPLSPSMGRPCGAAAG